MGRQLKKLAEIGRCVECIEDVLRYNEKTWSRVYFKIGYKSDMVDNNVNENFKWVDFRAQIKTNYFYVGRYHINSDEKIAY